MYRTKSICPRFTIECKGVKINTLLRSVDFDTVVKFKGGNVIVIPFI